MRTVIPTIVGLFITFPSLAADCEPPKLSKDALQLVKPLMELRIKQNKEQFTEDGRWKGESQYTPEVERRFYALLENRTKAGDEAVAYLLNVYMGEHPGEELVCEVVNRGKRMLPLIKSFSKCMPVVGVEPLPKFVQGSGFLPKYAIAGITKGERCEFN